MNQQGAAFLVSTLAGMATALGGLISFLLGAEPQRKAFATSLSFAGGVMLFISFVEAYDEGLQKVESAFRQRWPDDREEHINAKAAAVAMTLFFAGWMLASIINGLLGLVLSEEKSAKSNVALEQSHSQSNISLATTSEFDVTDLESQLTIHPKSTDKQIQPCFAALKRFFESKTVKLLTGAYEVSESEEQQAAQLFQSDCHRMLRLGITAMLVLTAHNIPEGIITFAGASSDLHLGLGLGIAVGIHNIPEGVAVAVPILYGTGSKAKAMLYATISGAAEPLGALLAWLIIGSDPHDLTYGVLFLLTAGLMVNVALKEMIFASLRYDAGNTITSLSILMGMMVMAITLIALKFATI